MWRLFVILGAVAIVGIGAQQTGIVKLFPSQKFFFSTTTPPIATTTISTSPPEPKKQNGDIGVQMPLRNPPSTIKAMYATSWSAGSTKQMNRLIELMKETELNAIVIDIKDYLGTVSYDTEFEPALKYGAVEVRTPHINALLKKLHDNGIYAIARISVFQDQRLPIARPELALMSSTTQTAWKDNRGLMWVDAASRDAWDYNIGIAKDALAHGFDEINFDYIRFASDGNLQDIVYPVWDKKRARALVIRDFWKYVRTALPDAKISADIFGLTTLATDDLGIGQKLEYALPYFDYIAPMVYPSHYYKGSLGYEQPAKYPYEIVNQSLMSAIDKMKVAQKKYDQYLASTSTSPVIVEKPIAKLRPWLQDFDLGAIYDANMVKAQIQATYDAASTTPELLSGWMLWDPKNQYTEGALERVTGE